MIMRFQAFILMPFVLLVCTGCCEPDCEGKCCGDDGCGGTCTNSCQEYFECHDCQCVTVDPCIYDEHCREGECCLDHQCVDESECQCQECNRDEQCADLGPCMECKDSCCTSFACESDADCPGTNDGPRMCCDYDDELGCRYCVTIHCWPGADEDCRDPTFPLYVECIYPEQAFCINGLCTCRTPCGGTCPDGQYCCRQTQTCDPIPDPCWDVECPPGERVNPEPGGTLNEETCQIEGADCSCVPGP